MQTISNSEFLEGQFLVAMPGMGDSRFDKTVIFICAHSSDGAMGFVVNKPIAEPDPVDFFEQLDIVSPDERADMPVEIAQASLYTGGPVEPGRGFVLHSPDFKSDATIKISKNISMTATLKILREIAMGRGPEKFFLALGYSGWSSGQLEEEIVSNGWLVTPADADLVFNTDCEGKYLKAMQNMGITPHFLSAESGHA